MIIQLQFKSKTPYYEKEEGGDKSNTVRKVGEADSRFDELMEIIQTDDYGRRKDRIRIINPDTEESFDRTITDVTYYDERFIISWNSQEGNVIVAKKAPKECGKVMGNYQDSQDHKVTMICGMQGRLCEECQESAQKEPTIKDKMRKEIDKGYDVFSKGVVPK